MTLALWKKRATVLVAGISLLGAGAFAAGGGTALAASGTTRYVSPSAVITNPDTGCSTAAYTSIQTALNASTSGDTVYVCAGTYNEQVKMLTSKITLTGVGPTAVIDPTSATLSTVTDFDHSDQIVPIVYVGTGVTGVTISNLLVNGAGLSPSFTGCGTDFAGILFQSASGTVSSATVENTALPLPDSGCQDGQGIYVETASGKTSSVSTVGNTVTGYDKTGIVCNDTGTTCSVEANTVTGIGTSDLSGENGVQLGNSASGNVWFNTISDNDYSGTVNTTEPQADYASGILLYGSSGTPAAYQNTLTDNQIAIQVVHSNSNIQKNNVTETGSGIADSIGVFAVPCDYYCSYFSLSGGSETVMVGANTISFPASATGTDAVWVGDGAASATGTVSVSIGNTVSQATNKLVVGPTATGSASF